MNRRAFGRELAVHLIVLVIALLPRLLGVRVFVNIDERDWAYGSAYFLTAIWNHDWSGTLWRFGHPGVTTRWAGAVGLVTKYLVGRFFGGVADGTTLLQFLQPALPIPYDLVDIDYLAMMRIPVILVTALGVVGIYSLTRMLLGNRIALLGALLIAFDPFHLAYSRLLLTDSFLAIFMSLSLYSFMVYIGLHKSPFYLALSGLMAGLAFLSKPPALFLVPYVALMTVVTALIYSAPQGRIRGTRHIIGILVIWGAIASLTFIILWPAMWVNPVEAILQISKEVARHEPFHPTAFFAFWPTSKYLLARLPHFLSYPLILLFQITPPVLIGIALTVFFLGEECYRHIRSVSSEGTKLRRILKAWRSHLLNGRKATLRMILLWLGAYVLLFIAFISFSVNVAARYLLPIFPPLALVAAVGLCQLVERAAKAVRWLYWKPAAKGMIDLAAVLVLQAVLSLSHYPYYFTYYNPMMGGSRTAPQTFPIGAGEGLDQAASYLNSKENAAALRAAVRPPASFAPFFSGQTIPFYWGEAYNVMPWYTADYAVLYIHQVQKGRPDAATVRYFRSLEPEHIVRLKGIDYAWVYKTPEEIPDSVIPARHIQRAQFGDCMLLRGYDIDTSQVAHDGKLGVNLYWHCSCPMHENYGVFLKLLNGARQVWGQQASRPLSDGLPTSQWEERVVVRDKREIEVLPGTLPGPYLIEVILYDFTSEKWVSSQGEENLLLGPVEIPRREIASIESLGIEHPLRANLGDKIQLLGYNLESGFHPGDGIHLTLFWQCLQKITQDYTVFTHLIDEENKTWAQKDNQPVDGFYATIRWEPGEIVRDQYDLLIPSDTPFGEYQVEVGMYLAETGERLPVLDPRTRQVADRVLIDGIQIRP